MRATALAKSDNVIPAPVTPMHLIERAAAAGASIEQMQQLFELKLRVEADEARKAYNKAFSAFKAESVSIIKNVTVGDGPLKGKKYADLFGVVSAVTDNDGGGSGKSSLPDDEFVSLRDAILDSADDDQLKKRYLTAQEAAKTAGDTNADRKFREAKNETYRKLHGSAR